MEVVDRRYALMEATGAVGNPRKVIVHGDIGIGKSCVYSVGLPVAWGLQDRASRSVICLVDTATSGVPRLDHPWDELLVGANTSNRIPRRGFARGPRQVRAQLPTLPEQLSFVRGTLSLNMTELAAALRVERPTLYAWFNARSSPQQQNQERIRALYRVAREWRRRSDMPVGELLRLRGDGPSLLELLQLDHVPLDDVRTRLAVLAEHERRRTDVKRSVGSRVKQAAAARGLDPVLAGTDAEDLRFITGRRRQPE